MKNLGRSQQKVYDFIKSEIKKHGYPPTVREICLATGLTSTSTIHSHLNALEKKGFIKRDPLKPRAIEILEDEFYGNRREIVNVPIVGKVAAGEPILAVENIEETFPISLDYLNNCEDVFMLRVQGESMIDVGINSNDYIIVKQQQTAQNGDIVVVIIEDSATVKTYYKEKSRVRLQPENSEMEPIYVREARILGKVIGLYRKY